MWRTVKDLPRPFFALAPMADVTDYAFRSLFVKHGKPDVLWTEFVSADGLLHSEAREHILQDLFYSEEERPIVAQLFTGTPEVMHQAAHIVSRLGFDGLDINMGCPDRSVERQGAGAGCIRDPARAAALVEAAKAGTGDTLPVSVKTRLGYGTDDMEWIRALLKTGIYALTVHLRTRNEMSNTPARWERVRDIVALRDAVSPDTLIIGNGDVRSQQQGVLLAEQFGADGVMVGRGAFGNPWFFSGYNPTVREKLETLIEHITLFECHVSHKRFPVIKKHFKAFVNDFGGASTLRVRLMETETPDRAREVLRLAILDL